jgi:glycine cleavage system H protein
LSKITLTFYLIISKMSPNLEADQGLVGNKYFGCYESQENSMSELPSELKYASSHEWARLESDGTIVVGITDHAQEALGDVVYVELPDVGTAIDAGAEVAVVESVKAASDIYAPVTGEVVEINPALEDEPETVNHSPYADGWFFRVKPAGLGELEDMLDVDDYQNVIDES